MPIIRNPLILILILIFVGCSHAPVPRVLSQDYNFLLADGQATKLVQRSDTLYQYECYVDSSCSPKPFTSYVILGIDSASEFTVVKVKMPEVASQSERGYSLMVLKNVNNKQLGYSQPQYNLTRQELDSVDVNTLPLEDFSFLTYFSDVYLKELSSLKKITTISAANEIFDAIPHKNSKAGKIAYSAEQLNMACIKKGYNPAGAGKSIDSLMRARAAKSELSKNPAD